jgi:dihydrofolate reductase
MACDEQGLIGNGKYLPDWNCPRDLDHFRAVTYGGTIVMGRNTYDGLPERVFEKRAGLVASTTLPDKPHPKVKTAKSLAYLAKLLKTVPDPQKVYLIGGANLVYQCFQQNLIGLFILSEIEGTYKGDCYLPKDMLQTLKNKWDITSTTEYPGFTITTHSNPNHPTHS